MCEGWFEKGRCTLPIKVECLCKSDCCAVELNLASLTCWVYCQILSIGISLIICYDQHSGRLLAGSMGLLLDFRCPINIGMLIL